MARWKLSRQHVNNEELIFSEGDEVTIGRGLNNIVTVHSLVVSRNHCVLFFKDDRVVVTDLGSSNGVYIGVTRINPNTPHDIFDSDVIGLGWIPGAPLVPISENQKYVYKLSKIIIYTRSKGIQFQNEQHLDDDIEGSLKKLHETKDVVKPSNDSLKRKLNPDNVNQDVEKVLDNINIAKEYISITDSDSEIHTNKEVKNKKTKLEPLTEKNEEKDNHVTTENDEIQSEAFTIKQEYLGHDDESIIQISSDEEVDSDLDQWLSRLSQGSPAKAPKEIAHNKDITPNDNSYSQSDYITLITNDENIELQKDDVVMITCSVQQETKEQDSIRDLPTTKNTQCSAVESKRDANLTTNEIITQLEEIQGDENQTDESTANVNQSHQSASCEPTQINEDKAEKIKLIKPASKHTPTGFSKKESVSQKSKTIKRSVSRKRNAKKKNQVKTQITKAQIEERKQKLKEIALKEKEESKSTNVSSINTSTIPLMRGENIAKVTTLNRGEFLTHNVEATVDHVKNTNKAKDTNAQTRKSNTVSKKENPTKKDEIKKRNSKKHEHSKKIKKDENLKNCKENEHRHTATKDKDNTKSTCVSDKSCDSNLPISVKHVVPLIGSGNSNTGKPFTKVFPLTSNLTSETAKKNIKKKVSFTDKDPEVIMFEIESGNQMKQTSLIKTTLLDARHMPVYSLEKLSLMKILRWNANWLDEQLQNSEPPPILGHNNSPMVIFHKFTDHSQYIQLLGDLLLMEIWECLTQGYKRLSKDNLGLLLQIDSLPPVPPKERYLDIFNISVNFSLPTTEIKTIPRTGDIMLITFEVGTAECNRLLFVNNVDRLPSRPNNIHSFFSISLSGTYSEKMGQLRSGQKLYGKVLSYINKELMLFEALEYVRGSPLIESILKPEPHLFIDLNELKPDDLRSQWTATLNSRQKLAVCSSVSAALGDKPGIQMVQGPPGTGKTSVICAIVMTYFYNVVGRKETNRGKILICATSNAAVDELVIRLLNIRKNLPREERFRMVRVGRAEAMHPRAAEVSSQQLAKRDVSRMKPTEPHVEEEISHIQAKINMWQMKSIDQTDKSRVVYCQARIADLKERMAQLQGNNAPQAKLLHEAEARTILHSDIVLTTLASARNHKMKRLKGSIALCIVDEAGQAIEPETLIPLTLDVTRITLIGDPQQLPGYICSQRARQYGLDKSLFSRLSNCMDLWPERPVVLLNEQYRMHPEIADYPNRTFYDHQIHTKTTPRCDLDIPPYCIVNIPSGDKGQSASGANEIEAWGVARLSLELQSSLKATDLKLAVITPYSAQRDLIRRFIQILQDPSDSQVEVNTVDSFQGQERDVVVVSLARSRGVGFLTDAGRMNVMLTRAKHALLVCLNSHAVMKNMQWRTLMEDAQRRKLFTTLPSRLCQGGAHYPHYPHGQILSHIKQLKRR